MPWPHGGSGTEEDPFLVNTADAIDDMRDYQDEDYYFKTTVSEISLEDYSAGQGWVPFRPGCNQWQGNGVHITNLRIHRNADQQGFIVAGALGMTSEVYGVLIIDADVDAGSGANGGIFCRAMGDLKVFDCFSSGIIKGGSQTGGFCSLHARFSSIIRCGSTATVIATGGPAGGFAYNIRSQVGREDMFFYGSVETTTAHGAAGFYLLDTSWYGDIPRTSIASAPVVSNDGAEDGFGGGEGGRDTCFWNTDIGPESDSSGALPKTTAELRNPATYPVEWDFSETWFFATLENLQSIFGASVGAQAYDRLPEHVKGLPWLRSCASVLGHGLEPSAKALFMFAGL